MELEDQRSAKHDALSAYVPLWLSHKVRVERTAGLDALLNEQWRIVNGHMNEMLERYFELTAGVELEAAVEAEDGRVAA